MTIFITGATGFIGEYLLNALILEGNTVHALYRSESKIQQLKHPLIKWFKGDISNYNSIIAAMTGCEQVYHIAALAVAWEPKVGDFYRFNVEGTNNVLNAAITCGVKKVVVTSTAGVYGPSHLQEVTENTISKLPHFTGYETSKAESERQIRERVLLGENIVIVNPTRVFGAGPLNDSNSVTRMIKMYGAGKWRFMPGNGKSIGNYVFVKDVVQGHILAMNKGKAGESYILGGYNLSYDQFFNCLALFFGKKRFMINIPLFVMLGVAHVFIFLNKIAGFKPPFTPAHMRKFNYNWVVSSQKAVQQLGFKVTPINEALAQTMI